jgi:hypothetical protein
MYIIAAVVGTIAVYYTLKCITCLGYSWVYASRKLLQCDIGSSKRAFYLLSLFMSTMVIGML